ncbi:hypothetical protein [uncultured Thiodictyon sp.]|uniref:hypothetical protein n=1 Tax=uncultured Thiodictyon sp. TaxID=1846217 RepID=UPI0025D76089|nr:hypothetical protein [uncultured Thiodictyon sp.]
MALDTETVSLLREAADYLSDKGLTRLASAVDAAILLNASLPNDLKEARSNGYQAALSHDCDVEEYGA